MNIFGWNFTRKDKPNPNVATLVDEDQEDGAAVLAADATSAGSYSGYGTYIDLGGNVSSDAELITKYREITEHPELDAAVDEICNEAINVDDEEIIKVDLDKVTPKLSPNMKKLIDTEFAAVCKLLDFNRLAYHYFRRWYVDGRLHAHVMIDSKKPEEGIQDIRYIDPRKIRKIREVTSVPVKGGVQLGGMASITRTVNEYFIYSDKGFDSKVSKSVTVGSGNDGVVGVKIAKDSIVLVTSGITDVTGQTARSYLHKAIKPLNELRALENALVIYRLARAPERRVWYIDVGNLPKAKAEQYMRDLMAQHKNRISYDAQNGEIRDERRYMSMLDDYWLARREGGKGTEVTTLEGGMTLGEMEDVLYFQKKLYKALNVPLGRLDSDAVFSLGRATELSRDEVKFDKFITRLRGQFSKLFSELLGKQVVLKKIMTIQEWESIEPMVTFVYARDNYYAELKELDIISNRLNILSIADPGTPPVGKYVSPQWAAKHIMRLNEQEIDEEGELIMESREDERWNPPIPGEDEEGGPPGDSGDGDGAPPAQDDEPDDEPDPKDKVAKAKKDYDLLAPKKGNRSMQDEAKFKSAAQILAKAK